MPLGRLAGFSLDRLMRFLLLPGSDAAIVVKPRTRGAVRSKVLVVRIPVRNLYTYFGRAHCSFGNLGRQVARSV